MINYKINKDDNIHFDEIKASFISFKHLNKELIYASLPLFSIKLRRMDNSSYIISSFDLKFKEKKDDTSFIYIGDKIDVNLKVKLINNGLSFKIKVKNKTSEVIEWVELPSFGLNPKLKDEDGGEGSVLFPFNEGSLVTNMRRRSRSPFPFIEPEYPSLGRYSIFPNMICSQFISYQLDDFGLYFGLHDPNRGTKHIDFKYEDNSLKIVTRVYSSKNYGEDYQTDFPLILKVFDGDVYKALDIYRNWLYKHLPEGTKKVINNTSLPKWYLNSPIIIATPIRGHKDTGDMSPNKLFPYENALPILEEYKKATNSPIMYLLMQYEGTAPWAPPYMFPPYGGKEMFDDFVKKIHQKHLYLGLYCSGFGYTVKSFIVPRYSQEEEFKSRHYKDILCSNSNGDISSTIVSNIREGYDLCPAVKESKRLFVDEMDKLLNSGVDYVQALDQNHGGCSYFCYSSKHDHPPVPGQWQQIEVNKILDMLDKPKKVLIGTESGASEPFIGKILFSDNRFNLNYYCGLPFPIYSYMYHEFLHNFMGNQICHTLSFEPYNYTFRLAYSFIAGDNLTAVINDEGEISNSWCSKLITNKEVALNFFKELNGWKQYKGNKYFNYGKMIKPIEVKTNYKTFKCEDSTIINVLGVHTAAYSFKGNKVQFIANYQLEETLVKLDKEYKIYTNYLSDEFIISDTIKMEPLSAVMVKIN